MSSICKMENRRSRHNKIAINRSICGSMPPEVKLPEITSKGMDLIFEPRTTKHSRKLSKDRVFNSFDYGKVRVFAQLIDKFMI